MTITIDLTPEQRDIVLQLLARHLPNTEAWAYGSRVKWTSRPQSDLDMVVFAKPQQARAVSNLREAFEESNLPFRVDLFVWDEVPEAFREQIEREYVAFERSALRANWRKVAIDDIADIAGGGTPSTKNAKNFDGDIPWLTPKDLSGIHERYVERGSRNLSQQGLDGSSAKLVPAGTVLLSTRAPIGYVALAKNPITTNQGFRALMGRDGVFSEYLYYWLKLNTEELERHASGSTFKELSGSSLKKIQLYLPPLPEQRAIAHILGTLDDKIELNRRMNQTLEAMARALFKSWFIDFDPVRAKMALKQHAAQPTTPPLKGYQQNKGASPPARRWGEVKRQYTRQTLQRARTLRQNRTDAEGLLWQYLRNKQLAGHKFRRQQSIGPYIVDFACMAQRLLVELDGGQHAEEQTYDQERDAFLRARGYNILRFWNNEVFENCFAVLERIYSVLSHYPIPEDRDTTHHSPMETENLTPEAQKNHSPLEGESAGQGRSPQSLRWGDAEAVGPGASRPPTESAFACGSTSSTPPQGGSDWTAERARAYLDNMDEEIIALFPDRLVDSKLGEIPEGWEVGYAEDGFEIVMGQSPPGHTYNDTGDGLPFFQGRSDFGFRYPKKRKFCTAPSRIAQPQDTIVSVRAPVGDINMAWEPCCIGRGVAALRPRSGAVSYGYYTIQALQGHMCEYENTGTVFGAINRKQLARLPLLQPTPNVIRGFERIVRPKDQMIRLRTAEIMNLTALRDTLLPKLISGEIRLSDAGKWVEFA